MKFAVLSIAAAAALAISAGSASAHPPGYYKPYYGGPVIIRPAPVVVAPVYPSYVYPSPGFYNYGSGFGLTINQPGFNFSIGNGVTPFYNYGGYSPYGYYGRRW